MNVFITDLASYNNGNLVGEWVSLPTDETDLQSKIDEILEHGSKVDGYGEIHEEYFITDFECVYYDVDEYENINKLNEIAEAMEELNDYEKKAVKFLFENGLVNNFEEAIKKYDEVIIYEDVTMEDIAYDFVNECYNLDEMPSVITNNIDYERIASELEMDGRYFVEGNTIYKYLG